MRVIPVTDDDRDRLLAAKFEIKMRSAALADAERDYARILKAIHGPLRQDLLKVKSSSSLFDREQATLSEDGKFIIIEPRIGF